MTGTPIWNMPPDLWAILTLIVPGGFGDYYSFCNRYGAPEPSAYGMKYTGISHEAELRKRIDEIMLRRRWVDVADDIPPITRNVLVANIDEKTKKKLDIIAAEIHSDRKNTAANLAHYRRVLSLFKVPTVVGEAKRMLDADESVVLWAWHKETADALLERIGERGYLIHGDISITKRDEIIAKWKQSKAEGRAVALIATMSVAQVGLDFSGASPIFAEIDWTPAVIAQTEMRTFDPKRPMNVTFVVADHLIEQRILRSLIAKLGAANPLGVGAAIDAIDALRTAVFGTPEEADLTRLLDAFLSEAE
jgi:SNF2 family DNA or RNA helicase